VIASSRKMIVSVLLASSLGVSTVTANAADIIDTATDGGQFNTLVAALQAAGLVDTLKGEGPFTVFAPSDAAFAKLPDGTVENMLLPENRDALVATLTYHVASGKIMSADISGDTMSVLTMQGGLLIVRSTDGVTINESAVITADIEADNGVIHAIDTVMLPQ